MQPGKILQCVSGRGSRIFRKARGTGRFRKMESRKGEKEKECPARQDREHSQAHKSFCHYCTSCKIKNEWREVKRWRTEK